MFSLFLKKKEMQLEIKKLIEDVDHQKRQNNLVIKEAVFAADMKAQSSIKEVIAERDRMITELKCRHAEEISKLKSDHAQLLNASESKYAQNSYEKLSLALTDLHQNGDKNSRFIQDMALEMIKKAPKALPGNTSVAISGTMADLQSE